MHVFICFWVYVWMYEVAAAVLFRCYFANCKFQCSTFRISLCERFFFCGILFLQVSFSRRRETEDFIFCGFKFYCWGWQTCFLVKCVSTSCVYDRVKWFFLAALGLNFLLRRLQKQTFTWNEGKMWWACFCKFNAPTPSFACVFASQALINIRNLTPRILAILLFNVASLSV